MKKNEFKISIQELEIFAIIGIEKNERLSKQKLIIDFRCLYNKPDKDFLDYSVIAGKIEEMLVVNKFLLIEDALEYIINYFMRHYLSIVELDLKITKPDILINCFVSCQKSLKR
jgi:dihydroneopterin aldolase